MNRKTALPVSVLTLAVTVYILVRGGESLQSARVGIDLFINSALPALFPFMVCAALLVQMGAADWMGRLARPIMRPVFGVPGAGSLALIVGLLSGYPTGARTAAQLYRAGALSRADAQRAALLCSACGPAFMIGAIGSGMLGNTAAGWVIAIAHWAAVLAVGAALGGRHRRAVHSDRTSANTNDIYRVDIGHALFSSLQTLALVAGYIIMFSVLSGPLQGEGAWRAAATGLLEMSNGCAAIARAPLAMDVKCCLLAGMVSFGGLCVIAQMLTAAQALGISPWRMLAVKSAHAGVSMLACAGLLRISAVQSSIAAWSGGRLPGAAGASLHGWYWVGAAILVLCAAGAPFNGRASARGSGG